jgi:putative two-component system response regulator
VNSTRGRTQGRILVADDVEANRELMVALLARDGYTVVTAADGNEALEAVEREPPDLVLSDVMMPEMNGFELCGRLKQQRATRLIPVVLVTALNERQDRIEGINAGADDFLTKPVDAHELRARVRSLIRLKRFTDDLDSAESVILSLALTVEARDAYTAGHCERMASYAAAFGECLGLGDEDIAALGRGGYLHDVGKIAVPDAVLSKPGTLTPEEFTVIQRHTTAGEALCGDLRILRPVRPIIRHHHERFDGGGYPDRLVGDDIPLLAQIMSIVDIFDALTTTRVYREAISEEAACAELRAEADRGWRRRDLVDAFVALCRSGGLRGRAEQSPNGGPRPFAAVVP